MSTINKKSRKPYRILTDVKNKIWDELHFLTDAKSVDAADGIDLETKVGAIRGITSSPNVTESGYAVDAAALNTRLGNQEFGFDSDGNFARREVGADTWVPFKNGELPDTIMYSLDVSFDTAEKQASTPAQSVSPTFQGIYNYATASVSSMLNDRASVYLEGGGSNIRLDSTKKEIPQGYNQVRLAMNNISDGIRRYGSIKVILSKK